MSHYFENDKDLKHDIQTHHFKILETTLILNTDHGVFSKENLDFGTRVLLESLDLSHAFNTIIDMGCGYGPIGIYVAKNQPKARVIMADINERAVYLAQENARLNKVKNVFIMVSDLFEKISEKADLIITNPPIRTGKKTIFKLYEDAYKHLVDGGFFYVVIQKKQGAPSTFEKLQVLFNSVTILKKEKGYWVLLAQK